MRRKISSIVLLLLACSLATAAFGAMALINRQEISGYLPSVLQSATSETSTADKKISVNSPVKSETNSSVKSSDKDVAESPDAGRIPVHISYLFLFKRVANLEKKAKEEEDKGKDGKIYREHYKDKAKLNEQQTAALSKVAKDCLSEVAKKDAEAQKIIDKIRSNYPDGKIKQGDPLPTPSAELTLLTQERDAVILRFLNILKENFSEAEFADFQRFVEADIASHISPSALTDNTGSVSDKGERGSRILPETSLDSDINQSKEQK